MKESAHSIMLKADGETLVPRLAAIADQHDAAVLATLSKDDRQAMERILCGREKQGGLRPISGRL